MDCMMVIPGNASGRLLVSSEPLSFWGGYDAATGEIIDRRHPLSGQNAAGRILAVPSTRGSSTTTQVLLEAIRAGTSPAAIVTTDADAYIALAAIVADEMWARVLPIAIVSEADFTTLASGRTAQLRDGVLAVE